MTPFFIVLSVILISAGTVPYALAQQEDNKTIIDNVEVPPSSVDQNALEYYHKAIDVATLHNASSDTISILNAQNQVYSCLDNLVSQQDANMESECDDTMTHAIVNHELGDNQTIIQLAHTYLKARGIQ
jgi:hypothetical protein